VFAYLVIVVAVLLAAYWWRQGLWKDPARERPVFVVLVVMLGLLLYVDRDVDQFRGPSGPLLLAIATDVSLSMGTMPETGSGADAGTRLERAQAALIPVLASLATTARPAMVSVSAFTSKAETILAWDDDLSLVREIIEYVLTTGLLTEAGSDLGVALNGVVPLFESLPEALRGADYAKFLVLVSDGEQTVDRSNSDAALAKLRELGVRIIALHVGMDEVPEGLPVYDDNGAYIGFEEVQGKIFSLPDTEVMRAIAGNDPQEGIFVKAEESGAAGEINEFVGLQGNGGPGGLLRFGVIVVLWGLLILILHRWA